MTASEILRISDESDRADRAELVEYLGNLCHRAQREFPVVGPTDQPSPWCLRHKAINDALDDLQAVA